MRERISRIERSLRVGMPVFCIDVLGSGMYRRVDHGRRELMSEEDYRQLRQRFPDARYILDDIPAK